ncbi:MAG: ABC transporter permease [Coriobacteriales bacterium]|nr:ABC transporter permease [Coriobacteriales bacterium]
MLFESLKMAWVSVRSSKMRSFLTMLGIIIGVFSLTVLVSVVSSVSDSVSGAVSRLASPTLEVMVLDDKGHPLKMEDLQAFENTGDIGSISPEIQMTMPIKSGYVKKDARVTCVAPVYQQMQGLNIGQGRFIKQPDMDNHSQVVVVSADVTKEVMKVARPEDAIGGHVTIGGYDFVVVGVIDKEESDAVQDALSFQPSYVCYIPWTSAIRAYDQAHNIDRFVLTAAPEKTLTDAQKQITNALLARFNNDRDAFTVMNIDEAMASLNTITGTLSLLMGSVAGISLLVGGIGIMNIMLVSVTERTREIGIRKAIGATRSTILQQFLMESLMISLMGCAVGLLLSWGVLSLATALVPKMTFSVSPGVMLLSAGFSSGIGLVFGLYPANKAAKMKPIDALRAV